VGGSQAALIAFIVAAFTLTILMFVLSFTIAFAQERLVDTLRTSVVSIKRWGGRILILVGIWLIILAIFAQTFARIFPV
jgi:cytochrome c biogenesis protein CcdA